MIFYKNAEGVNYFQLEGIEEIDKFCQFFYDNHDYVNSHYKDVSDYKRYVTLSRKYGENNWCGPMIIDSLKCENLMKEFSKMTKTTYSDEIVPWKVFSSCEIEKKKEYSILINGDKDQIKDIITDLALSGKKIDLDSIKITRNKSDNLDLMKNKLKKHIELEEYEKAQEMKDEIEWFEKNMN